ncbi:hypothetical protein [Xanthomonas vasicola]|uniref:hypothetical protein n=1 Tax=Xanthomonas vasicola TaxID=56459 RepID=UPI0002ECAA93|nr:hypothetical protein [Xanthomonas vasicola]AZR28705.1 hypothetical protein NX80_022175 [Xanthomonas vasicola pv. arecae]AZR31931.1 hypothetical protein KWO_016890 [Xanthomonas vasicola pv. musacearum NCPPB 4379]KEZ98154.1 hypothetical protein A11M_0107270 [Xanthomonas vasicola pv. vasculorum NCPPB 895]KFA11287.1 hypothetical protein KWM_0106810 [Xanthomonas vasicola pv. musacearum NCPPB 2005]KFA15691.1 hypothetical protein KWQ_0101180 [Xanthomonas vasicola pv. musacearum NCPPB 4380]
MMNIGAKLLLATCIIASTANAAETGQTAASASAGRTAAISSWETTIRQEAPTMEGCFRSSFPNNGWQATACVPSPKLRSRPPAITVHKDGTITARTDAALTAGNSVDYVAGTRQLIQSTLGTFPSVTGVATGVADYSLQINTNLDRNAVTCAQFGYSSCWTWQQFFYSTDYDGDPINGRTPVIFIENWFYAGNAEEFEAKGCPSGWNSYSTFDYNACYSTSDGVIVPLVPISQIGSIKMSASATAGGVDTVTFSINGRAYSVSQNADTLNINRIWRRSEFNIFGNGSDHPLVLFNSGSHVTVNVAVKDGTSNAPRCLGPNAGYSAQENNLTLGKCTASGGASPSITFTESN